ncbi:3-phosphoglycerate dehydrogenase family protein [Eubacteriales bacterium OttesenSCG-928-K08]|nr:3-phosphoglycerate dehydrogenase family protein [Eubacteriales bacterium OttesenSCG-928-K08]
MHRILTLNAISDVVRNELKPDRYQISDHEENPTAILVRSADCRERELNEGLLAIARAGAGVNNIPVSRCTQEGIAVFNTPGANANAVKELALCCLLLASRNVLEGIAWVNTLSGEDVPMQVEQGKRQFVGNELHGKTLAVIGLGAIGVMVANDAHAIGMHVIGYDPFISVEHAWGLSRAIERGNSLEEILPHCDYITIHVPLMEKTRNYINERVLSLVKPGTMLMNLARGELVDNAALLAAVESGKISRYVTDFPTEELLNKKNIICVPHLGATTPESEENCARMAAQQLNDYIAYGNIRNSVNLPQCEMVPSGVYRICLLHKNSPNMVGRITAVVGAAQCNIANMINKSRGELAYTILDLDHELPEYGQTSLTQIRGMMRVRSLTLS